MVNGPSFHYLGTYLNTQIPHTMKNICPPLVLLLTIAIIMLGEMRAVGQVIDENPTNCGTSLPSATGDCSAAIGESSDASGDHGISIGDNSEASGDYSLSFGNGAVATDQQAIAIGNHANASSPFSISIGELVTAGANRAYVFGLGHDGGNLSNSISNSIMFGMNSTVPTLYISPSVSTSTWGNVGIGSIAPDGLLHLLNRSGENTDLILEKAAAQSARLIFDEAGTQSAMLRYDASEDLHAENLKLNRDIYLNVNNNSALVPAIRIQGTVGTTTDLNDFPRVHIGSTSKGADLWVLANEQLGIAEDVARFGVSDVTFTGASGEYVSITNQNDNDAEFSGGFVGRTSSQEEAFYLRGTLLTSGADGGNRPGMLFDVASLATGTINTRPLFRWTNDNTIQMQMVNNGDLGIGCGNTFVPMGRLHIRNVNGNNTLAIHRETSYSGALRFYSSTNTERANLVLDANNDLTLAALTSNRDIIFSTAPGGEQMRIDGSTSRVGIGTTTPSGKLHVNGTVFITYNTTNLPPSATIGGSPGSEEDLGINVSSGQFINLSTSSIHFKDNVEDIQFDREAFHNLRPVNFRWKDLYGGQADVGLIAQEVSESFPALASWSYKFTHLDNGDLLRDSLGLPVVDSTQFEVSGVKYHKLPVYLLAESQIQRQEILELRQQVQELTERLDGCCAVVEPMNRMNDGNMEVSNNLDEFILLQNDPNPFVDFTDVHYEHADCLSCEIIVSDISGKIIKRIMTSGSKGTIRIFSSEIGSGLFSYSLVKDGRTVRSERMVSSIR